jgi:hypothetical protein
LPKSALTWRFHNHRTAAERRGRKPGSNTTAAFAKLAEVASINDTAINRAIGEALKAAGVIKSYETEKPFGTDWTDYSDLYVINASGERIRLEFMWRRSTGPPIFRTTSQEARKLREGDRIA